MVAISADFHILICWVAVQIVWCLSGLAIEIVDSVCSVACPFSRYDIRYGYAIVDTGHWMQCASSVVT